MSWASHMQQANIHFRPDLARVEVSGRFVGEGGTLKGDGGETLELGVCFQYWGQSCCVACIVFSKVAHSVSIELS